MASQEDINKLIYKEWDRKFVIGDTIGFWDRIVTVTRKEKRNNPCTSHDRNIQCDIHCDRFTISTTQQVPRMVKQVTKNQLVRGILSYAKFHSENPDYVAMNRQSRAPVRQAPVQQAPKPRPLTPHPQARKPLTLMRHPNNTYNPPQMSKPKVFFFII